MPHQGGYEIEDNDDVQNLHTILCSCIVFSFLVLSHFWILLEFIHMHVTEAAPVFSLA